MSSTIKNPMALREHEDYTWKGYAFKDCQRAGMSIDDSESLAMKIYTGTGTIPAPTG